MSIHLLLLADSIRSPGEVHNSTLKPIGRNITMRGINTDKEEIQEMLVEAASDEEIANTVAVMGGEDRANVD